MFSQKYNKTQKHLVRYVHSCFDNQCDCSPETTPKEVKVMGSLDHIIYHFIVLSLLCGLSIQFGDRVGRLTPRSSRQLIIDYDKAVPRLDSQIKSKASRFQIGSFLGAWKKLTESQKIDVNVNDTFTIFAPFDAVFAARLPPDISEFLLNDNFFQQMVVLNHISKDKVYASELEHMGETDRRTLSGHALYVHKNKSDGSVKVNGVQILDGPVETPRFLVYVIDELLDISSNDIIHAVERGVQSETKPRTTPKVRRSSPTVVPQREGIKPPRGPPRPPGPHKVVSSNPQPPSIPLNVRSPAPPIDGPQPPAWIPETAADPSVEKEKKKQNVIMLGSITKKRNIDEKNLNAIEEPLKADSHEADGYLNAGSLARQGVNQRLMLAELMSPLMKTSAKEISKMMKKEMELAEDGIKPKLAATIIQKLGSENQKKSSRTGRDRNLATATIFSSLPIYQFLTGAVAARVDLRKGNLTLLAPSDLALHRLELSLPALIIRNRQSAVRLIRNHVIEGTVTIREAIDAGVVQSVDGNELSFEGDSGTYSINGVPVLTPDVILNNGIIHVIDGVLIPDDSTDFDLVQDGNNKNTDKIAAEIESVLQDLFPEPDVTTPSTTSSSTMPTIEMDLDDENIEPLPHALRPISFPNLFAMVDADAGLIDEFIPGMRVPLPPSPEVEQESAELTTSTTKKPKNSKKFKIPTTRAPVESEEDFIDGLDDGFVEEFGDVKAPAAPSTRNTQAAAAVSEKIISPVEIQPVEIADQETLMEPLNDIANFAEVFQHTKTEDDSIVPVLQRNGCSNMLSLLERADLISKFESGGPFTVFAPNDKAFENLPSERLRELTLRPMLLRRLLLFHIVAQENQETEEVGNDVLFTTMEGSPIRFNIYDGEVLVNGAKVIVTDQVFNNGVVHILEQIIFPPLGSTAVTMKDRDFGTKHFLEAFENETVNILEGSAPITVIAPIDAAFDELNVTWSELSTDFKDALSTVINGHVIPGVLYSQGCATETQLFTANGEMVKCLFADGKLFFNGIEAIDKDITATNGVIHLIPMLLQLPKLPTEAENITTTDGTLITSTLAGFEDAFFTPQQSETKIEGPAETVKENITEEIIPKNTFPETIEDELEPEAETLPPVMIMRPAKTKPKKMPATVSSAIERHNLTIFSKFLEASSLKELVDQDGPWTIFAPTNNAFAMMPAAIVQQLSHDRLYLKRILSYHIVPGRLTKRHLANDAVFPTLSDGTEIRTNQYSDGKVMWYTVSGSRILELDEIAGNGVIHILENVLYPPHGDILTTLNGSPILMQISMLIHNMAINNELQGDPITLFVPNDESFQHLNSKTMKNQRRLRAWLRKHIVKGTHYSSGLFEGKSLESLDGTTRINITESSHCINANGQEILYPDISVTNGVLHVTNGLMFTV